MPPKVKITKEDVIKTALSLVREKGEEAVNARAVATALGCSTQPVFSNFSGMEELFEEVKKAAHRHYLGFLQKEAESGKYPTYKAFGMAYIRFAKEEKALFKLLFMCDRRGEELPSTMDFDASVEIIMKANGVARDVASLMHMEMWVFVHGIATMVATSFLSLDEELVSQMLSDVYQGIRAKHVEVRSEKE